MSATFPQAAPRALQADEDGYQELLDAATAPLRDVLGDRVVVEVERLDCLGRWAFLMGNMRTPGGQRPDFRGTQYAEHAAAGSMSDLYVALLRRDPEGAEMEEAAADAHSAAEATDDGGPADCLEEPGQWVVLDHAIGPGDVAWLDWPARHAAPRAVFGF